MKGFTFFTVGWMLVLAAGMAGAQTWNCGDTNDNVADSANVTATLSGGTLTISGTGRMRDYRRNFADMNAGRCVRNDAPWLASSGSFCDTEDPTLGITSVVIEDGVTNIGERTCYKCTNLTSITIPSSVTTIKGAFQGCTKLTSVTIPSGVDTLFYAFRGCTGLTSVTISNGVKYLDDFNGCTGITSITIPNSVQYLAGFDSTGITSLTIPNSVWNLGGFNYTGLTSITIPNASVNDGAFRGCTNLKSVTIGNGARIIGAYAFDSCLALTSVVIGNGVTKIGATSSSTGVHPEAFKYCQALKSLIIGNGLKTLSGLGLSFSTFTQLDTLIIGNGLTSKEVVYTESRDLTYASIGSGAIGGFAGCAKLKTLILGDSVKAIGGGAFNSCSTLTSVTIPNNIDSIGSDAFFGCSALSFAAIGSGKIGYRAFGGLANLTTLILGNNVKSIGESAFSGCTKLTTLTVPDNVKTVGASAFSGCPRLQTATIGNDVDTIGANAFRNCAGLTSVIIGNKVKSIGASAFSGCTGLASLTSLASDPPVVGVAANNGTFDGIDKAVCKLKVQQVDMGMYRAAAGWKDFTNIEAVQFPNVPVLDITGVPLSFKVGEVLTLTGTVTPSTATNKAIEWSVAGASISGTNFTGAVIEGGNKLSAAAPGTVVVRAAIPSGAITGVDFERYFFISAESADEEVTSVLSGGRVVPSVKSVEVSAVAPVVKLTAKFTAGPNPAGVSGASSVRFFYGGVLAKGATFHIYDASGALVRSVTSGAWDLRDARGRPVSSGAYLVRGVVAVKGGKREKVSAVVGVR
jgi:hypothetical protein